MFDYRASGLYFGGLNKVGALPLTGSVPLATVWNDFQLLTRVSRLSYKKKNLVFQMKIWFVFTS